MKMVDNERRVKEKGGNEVRDSGRQGKFEEKISFPSFEVKIYK